MRNLRARLRGMHKPMADFVVYRYWIGNFTTVALARGTNPVALIVVSQPPR